MTKCIVFIGDDSFIRDRPMNEKSRGYIQNPEPSDKVHSVIIIFSSTHASDIHSEYKAGLRSVSKLMHKQNIPRSVVLTKCDLLCSDTKQNISNIFKSKRVVSAVDAVAHGFGIPAGDVHPVVNYDCKMDEDPLQSIPLLLALRAVLYKAQDRALQEDVSCIADGNEEAASSQQTEEQS